MVIYNYDYKLPIREGLKKKYGNFHTFFFEPFPKAVLIFVWQTISIVSFYQQQADQ